MGRSFTGQVGQEKYFAFVMLVGLRFLQQGRDRLATNFGKPSQWLAPFSRQAI